MAQAVSRIVGRLAVIARTSSTGMATRRRRLLAARHVSEQADLFRPVMGSPYTGQGREDATTASPRALGAARSDSESEKVLGLVFRASGDARGTKGGIPREPLRPSPTAGVVARWLLRENLRLRRTPPLRGR
jgi:hypothetical protein